MYNTLTDKTNDPIASAKDNAWNEGWLAYREEKNIDQNPYIDKTLRKAWEDGYMDNWEMDMFH